MTTNKKASNKKVKKVKPGESTRSYKNKPLDERIGYTNSKSRKYVERQYSIGPVPRNGKNSLNELAINATTNPNGSWNPVACNNKSDYERLSVNTNFSAQTKKYRTADSSVCLNPSKTGFIINTVKYNQDGLLIRDEITKIKLN